MSNDRYPERDPLRPRAEPEIIPPGEQGRGPRGEPLFGYGVHRIYVARPGWPSIVLGLLILGAIMAMVSLVLIGFVLLLPFLVGGLALALIAGALFRGRRY
jgi:hypothetical protein